MFTNNLYSCTEDSLPGKWRRICRIDVVPCAKLLVGNLLFLRACGSWIPAWGQLICWLPVLSGLICVFPVRLTSLSCGNITLYISELSLFVCWILALSTLIAILFACVDRLIEERRTVWSEGGNYLLFILCAFYFNEKSIKLHYNTPVFTIFSAFCWVFCCVIFISGFVCVLSVYLLLCMSECLTSNNSKKALFYLVRIYSRVIVGSARLIIIYRYIQ